MANNTEKKRSGHNVNYYNQILRDAEKKSAHKRVKNRESFAKKEVDFKKYLIVVDDYEAFFYTVYFVSIPYIVGAIFLFLYATKGVYDDFFLLELDRFLIIWAIGYEITAAFLLVMIFISYLQFLKNSHKS